MSKAAVVGNNFLYEEIISNFKDLFDFVPLISISEQFDDTIVVKQLISNINIRKINLTNIETVLSDFDIIIITSPISDKLLKKFEYVKALKVDITKASINMEQDNIINLAIDDTKSSDSIIPFIVICEVLRKIRSYGYYINIESNMEPYNNIFSLMGKYDKPDFTLRVCESTTSDLSFKIDFNNYRNKIDEAVSVLRCICREKISPLEYINRDMPLFHKVDRKNFNILQKPNGGAILFKSCNRSSVPLSVEDNVNIFLYNPNYIDYFRRFDNNGFFEYFHEIRYYERQKEKEYSTLTTSKFVNIKNIDSIILSYLGARKCNLNCKYCFSDHEKNDFPILDRDTIIEIANYVLKGNSNINLHIDNYIGGEPTLDFETFQFLHYVMYYYHKAHGINTSFSFLTNGTKLTEEQLKWLRENTPYVGFSLDGDEKTHDAIRVDKSGKGTYEKVVKQIEILNSMDWPVKTGVSCVVTANNVNIKDIFLHFITKLNIHNVVIKPLRAPESSSIALTMNNFELLKNGYKSLFEFLYEKSKEGDISYLKSMLMPLDYAGRFFIRVLLEDRVVIKRCGAGEHIFSVGNDACIYPCDSFNGIKEVCLVNIKDKEIFSNFEVPFLNKGSDIFGCSQCWARYYCGGVCQYVQFINSYKLNSVTKFECELAKFLIEEAIIFWEVAKKEYAPEVMEKIIDHIMNIGFEKYKDRDSFYYAPC